MGNLLGHIQNYMSYKKFIGLPKNKKNINWVAISAVVTAFLAWATFDLAKSTRDNAYIELRAYLGYSINESNSYGEWLIEGNVLKVKRIIKNYGNTPARDIKSQICLKVPPMNKLICSDKLIFGELMPGNDGMVETSIMVPLDDKESNWLNWSGFFKESTPDLMDIFFYRVYSGDCYKKTKSVSVTTSSPSMLVPTDNPFLEEKIPCNY